MSPIRCLVAVLVSVLAACSTHGGSGEGAGGSDAGGVGPSDLGAPADRGPTDSGAIRDVRDASTAADLPPSRAGNACRTSAECGAGLECDTDSPGGFCTADCTDNPDPTNEARQCGGAGATCVSDSETPAEASPFCTRACSPEARTESMGACRMGQVCTGFWGYRESGEPDRPGCVPFCSADADCAGMRCNTYTGECGMTGADTRLRIDGEPCDTMAVDMTTRRSTQCRGFCVLVSDMARRGICGSEINLRVTSACPDDAARLLPETVVDDMGRRLDNLGLCLFKNCQTNANCTAPLVCVDPGDGDASYCDYPENRP